MGDILIKIGVATGLVACGLTFYLRASETDPKKESFINYILASKIRTIWIIIFLLTIVAFLSITFIYAGGVSKMLANGELAYEELKTRKMSFLEVVKQAY